MRCVIYCRISSSDDGSTLGVERQRQDCEVLARKLGWEVAYVAVDNDISNFTAKLRPAYERVLRDLEAGKVDGLLCWDVDRLTRRPVELEHIIDLAEKKGIHLASVGGDVDLATPQGRLTARIKGSVARHEVEQSSRRITRKSLERAQAGRPHGKVSYGWTRVDGVDVLSNDAPIVREIVTRLLIGESVSAITHDLNQRGIPSSDGTLWQRTTVRSIALRASNAGLRKYQGKIIGKSQCEPIISESEYYRLLAMLHDPVRRTSPTNAYRHLLTGIALCGVCDGQIRLFSSHKSNSYVCRDKKCVRRTQAPVDQLIRKLMIARLSMPDAASIFIPADNSDLASEAETLRARLDLVADQYANDEIDGQQLKRITAKLRPRLEALEAEIHSSAPHLIDLATPDIGERWDDVPLERRRAAIKLLLEVRILPWGRNHPNGFEPSSISARWKEAAATSRTAPA